MYDATGRRIKRTDSSSSTVFACWGHDVIADYTSGNAPASPTRQYIYGDQIDNVLVMIRASDEMYYHADAQTSIRCLTNDTGSLVERYLYTAYGVPTIFNGREQKSPQQRTTTDSCTQPANGIAKLTISTSEHAGTGRAWDDLPAVTHCITLTAQASTADTSARGVSILGGGMKKPSQ